MDQGVRLGGGPDCYLDTRQAAAVLGLSARSQYLLSVLLTLTTHAALKANKLVAGDDHGAGRGAGQPGVR